MYEESERDLREVRALAWETGLRLWAATQAINNLSEKYTTT